MPTHPQRARHATPLTLALALSASLAHAACSSSSAATDAGVASDVAEATDRRSTADVAVASDIRTDVQLPALIWSTCDISDWPDGYPPPPKEMECTTVPVPVDYSTPAGKQLTLRVSRLRSKAYPTQKAVFYVEGGPGKSSVFVSGVIARAPLDVLASFDLVFVDLRGTGGSGYLGCPKDPETADDLIACGKAQSGTDLNHMLSVDAAHDLETIRSRIGYDKMYLYGVSYGTRVAFDYLRLYPERTVAAVLDGVAPPPIDLFTNTITAADRGVQMLVSDCSNDSACLAVSPNLAEDLDARRAALRESPRPFKVNGVKYVETESQFVSWLQEMLHFWDARFRVPKAIHQAVQGDNGAWNKLLSDFYGVTFSDATGTSSRATTGPVFPSSPLRSRFRRPRDTDNYGASVDSIAIWMTMVCAESYPNSPGLTALQTLFAQQQWARGSMVAKASVCQSWPVNPIPASQRQYLSTSARVLLISGAIDINVDPKWAVAAATSLSNGHHVVIPYATHLPTEDNACAGKIASAFFAADGDFSSVDTSCVEALPSPGWN